MNVKCRALNLAAIIEWNARRFPNKECIVYEDFVNPPKRITYREFCERIHASAKALLDLGIQKGDRIAIILYNCPEYVELFHSACKIGAITVPINHRLAGPEISYIINKTRPVAIVSEPEFVNTISSVKSEWTTVEHYLCVGGPVPEGWISYDKLVTENLGVKVPNVEVGLDDTIRILFTTGTTGFPKGVEITYLMHYFKTLAHIIHHNLTPADKLVFAGTMFHVVYDLAPANVLTVGGTVILHRRWNTRKYVEAIERERATMIGHIPTALIDIANLPDIKKYDLSSVRLIWDGGQATPEAIIRKILEIFPNATFAYGYGLTESTSGDNFFDYFDREGALKRPGSSGTAVPFVDVGVVDDQGNFLGPGQVGEIVLRGPKVATRYYEAPKETEEAFKNGWFHTGDIGKIDEEGYIYILDRKKDMIKSGGENIASIEIDSILYEYPKVLEAATIAVPDKRWMEVPAAFIVPKPGEVLTEEELREFCLKKLAKFKVPKYFIFVKELPKSPVGKILKRELRELVKKYLPELYQ
jgi:acyl-CoA synthetase (AMP-forming)/AMP-acid ligase II